MTTRDRLLAVTVAVAWGLNFIAIDRALTHFPPFLLVAVRFAVMAVPTMLLVPWPRVRWTWWLLYGVGFGVLQFAFLFGAMAHGMPAGLASLVLQSSAPFTVLLGALFLRESLSRRQVVGITVAVVGLAVVGLHRAQAAAWIPFALTLCGGLGWALGNVASRQARPEQPMHLMLWMTVVPPLPMLAMSWAFEGGDAITSSLSTMFTADAVPALLGLAYIVLVGTVLGSGLWTGLLSRHPSSVVAPFSMLVPVVGMTAAAVLLHERVDPVEVAGAALVVAGVGWASTTARRRAVARTGLEEPARA
ncbi:MAG: EamA family transporter [Nocardioidaceae bacterium]|nr:EamA family transporter [Nocardioidaceae bacterium]